MKEERLRVFDDYEPYYSLSLSESESNELYELDYKNHFGILSEKEKERMNFLFDKCLKEDKKLEEEHNKSYWKMYNETLKKIREK